MLESPFFELPSDEAEFSSFLSGVTATGGGDASENGLEALYLAMKSDFSTGPKDRQVIVMFTDADLAYGTDVIKRVAETFDANPDAKLVIGSRNLSGDGYEGYTFIRKLASKTYIKVLCMTGGFKLSDSQCGCKAFRRDAVKNIFPRCEVNGFAFDFEAILWSVKLGMKIKEIPVKVINHRESKVRVIRDTVKMLRDLRKMKKRIKKAKI
jgi:dolichyl-phosphate beta-glucosyltransferase